jgi:uncharacterized protein (DUF983 family)
MNNWIPMLITMNLILIKSVFGSVVAGAFQIAFRAEMHANDVFLFFKNHF